MQATDTPRYYVYGLTDRRFPTDIRYIGVSVNPYARYQNHIREAYRGDQTYKCKWIRKVLKDKSSVDSHVLYQFEFEEEAYEFERYLIFEMKKSGHMLTNTHEGGVGGWASVGVLGREKVSALWKDPEFKRRQSEKYKQGWTPEARKKRSDMNIERWESEEFRTKHAESLEKAQRETDYIGKATAARKKPGHYDKVSVSAKRYWEEMPPSKKAEELHKRKLNGRARAARNRGHVLTVIQHHEHKENNENPKED